MLMCHGSTRVSASLMTVYFTWNCSRTVRGTRAASVKTRNLKLWKNKKIKIGIWSEDYAMEGGYIWHRWIHSNCNCTASHLLSTWSVFPRHKVIISDLNTSTKQKAFIPDWFPLSDPWTSVSLPDPFLDYFACLICQSGLTKVTSNFYVTCFSLSHAALV